MTTTDKTRQKLVDSMRKTKAETETETKTNTTTTKASAPKTKKTRARRASTKPAGDTGSVVATKKSKTAPAKSTSAASDPYQGGRRVWPD